MNMTQKQLQKIIEAAIFASRRPIKVEALCRLFEEGDKPEKDDIQDALDALAKHYEKRGVTLAEVSTGYRFQVNQDIAPELTSLFEEKPARYSRALLETLALIAYQQPITRAEVEEVRGVVVSTNIMRTLLEHGWVRSVGHRDVPGRPALYATTKEFLDHFGMKSLEELPPLSDIQSLEIPELENVMPALGDEPEAQEAAAARAVEEAMAEMLEEEGIEAEEPSADNIEETLTEEEQDAIVERLEAFEDVIVTCHNEIESSKVDNADKT